VLKDLVLDISQKKYLACSGVLIMSKYTFALGQKAEFMRTGNISFPVADGDFKVSGWCGNRPACVQVAVKSDGIAVRDSKDSGKSTLYFTHDEWNAFVKGVKSGEFAPQV
jgi:hypothetical protein